MPGYFFETGVIEIAAGEGKEIGTGGMVLIHVTVLWGIRGGDRLYAFVEKESSEPNSASEK